MVRAASATRVAANADKIRALARGVGEGERKPRTKTEPRHDVHEEEVAMEQGRQGRQVPTDILSDGYDSGGDAGSEQVLALLRSGVSARQSMDLNNASSEYRRAASLQRSRKNKPKNKYTIWLRGRAQQHGKDAVRAAARDIQRYYRGMLGREDAAWHRLQRKKKLRAEQAALDAKRQKEATALLQRCFRGHRARLQAAWRRRIRAERLRATLVLQSYGRRVAARTLVIHLRRDAARKSAVARLQACVRAALVRALVAQQRSDAAVCLQRAARWALSKQLLAAVLKRQAATTLQAARARACAQIRLKDVRRMEQARLDAEAALEAARRHQSKQRAAVTSIATAWLQRRARCIVLQRLIVRRVPSFLPPQDAASTRDVKPAASYAQGTKSSNAKRNDSPASGVAKVPAAAALSESSVRAAGHDACTRECEEELIMLGAMASPAIGPLRLHQVLASSAHITRRAAAVQTLWCAWKARRERRCVESRRVFREEEERQIANSRAGVLQRWWLARSSILCRRRRWAGSAALAAHSAAAAALLSRYGADGGKAASVVGRGVRCWQARRRLALRQGESNDARTRARQHAAALAVCSAWRRHVSRRQVREAREKRGMQVREVAALRVAGAFSAWQDRQQSADELLREGAERRERAATRLRAAFHCRRARKVVIALALARDSRMSLLQEGAARIVSRAWLAAISRRSLRDARRRRDEKEAERIAQVEAREGLAASQLQAPVRRLWAMWTMRFYVSDSFSSQLPWALWGGGVLGSVPCALC